MKLYNSGNFELASELLLQTSNPDAQFYGAVSALGSGNIGAASKLLEGMVDKADFMKYSDAIEYYLSLAYLMQNEISKAKVQLNKVIENAGYYSKYAKELKTKL